MTVAVLGIRHHGPGSARSLLRALDDLEPDRVLIEAPADTADALTWIAQADLVPPVALLGFVPDRPERVVFLPFASFSPEWCAARWAAARGVPVAPIDLPLSAVLAGDGRDAGADDEIVPDALALLAAAAGDDDPERWWEDVVEHRGDGPAAFDVVAEAMRAVREGWVPPPGEARREAAMRQGIRQARADGATRIAVVCGAWHVPALVEPMPTKADDARLLRGLPRTKVSVTWVPWSHRRLATGSGYRAGVESPGWYAHVFAHPGPDGIARWFVRTAGLLRSVGHLTSPDHVIAGVRLADLLASLRDRPRPGLAEVLDATGAVLGEGGPGPMALVRDELVIGDALGEVPDDAPQAPLARDLARALRAARLKPVAGSKVHELDLRSALGRTRSHLLHRMVALGLQGPVPESGRGSSGTFRETWRLRWPPEDAVRLVARSALGTTVRAAAATRLLEQASAAPGPGALVGVLERALLAEPPEAVGPAASRLAGLAAHDPDVGHLLDALGPLARTCRYGDVRATDVGAMRAVLDGLVERVVAGLGPACATLDDGAAAAMAERLDAAQAALALVDHPARAASWPRVLTELAATAGHGLVQGRATRLLHDGGQWDAGQVAGRLGRALGPGTPPATGAAFVEGFLAGSGTLLVHDAELLRLLDDWVAGLSGPSFEAVVALLRRTFGGFEVAERRQVGELVAGRSRALGPGVAAELDPERVALALATVRRLEGLAS